MMFLFSRSGSNDTHVEKLCADQEMKSVLSLDHTMVVELEVKGGPLPSDIFFNAMYYECK